MTGNNHEEIRLLGILFDKHNTIILNKGETDKSFLDVMCGKGYLRNLESITETNYYHVNKKFKNKILEMLRVID